MDLFSVESVSGKKSADEITKFVRLLTLADDWRDMYLNQPKSYGIKKLNPHTRGFSLLDSDEEYSITAIADKYDRMFMRQFFGRNLIRATLSVFPIDEPTRGVAIRAFDHRIEVSHGELPFGEQTTTDLIVPADIEIVNNGLTKLIQVGASNITRMADR